ncbi:LOW QUALITY PROTEIN: FERM and PDZ domain-containing protein 1-like, partial [Coregonus clupeaformis]|uniref:LOW QUALITY PROTEIN: FERM and PDZ domain-containing protein 1-like n=1 Tax=Coregonus clupeaformis TaxID=59861 RepID=UPI001E1C6F93
LRDPLLNTHGLTLTPQTPILVQDVTPAGPADGRLVPGDQVVKINNVAVDDLTPEQAADLIRECQCSVMITVLRNSVGPKSSFITPEKRAKLRSNPVKVRFAEEVEVNGHSQGNSLLFLPNVLKVYLENGQTKAFKFEPNTTVKDIVMTLKEKLSLSRIEHFSLVLEQKYSISKLLLLHEEERIQQVVHQKEVHDYRCLFRVCFVPREPEHLLQDDPTAFHYLYLQGINDVLQERFAVEMRCNTALRLAALQIQERLASCGQSPKTNLKIITKSWGIENFVSSTLLRNMREKDLRKAIGYHMKKSQSQEPKQKVLSANQAKIDYLAELCDLKSFGGKSFSATMMLQDRESMVTLLVGSRYGISQVVNHKLSIMTSLTEFSSITRIELLPESDRVSLVKIYLQDIKPITLLLESVAAKDMSCLVAGYCRALVDPSLIIFPWTQDAKQHRVSAEEGYVSRCGSDSDDSSDMDTLISLVSHNNKRTASDPVGLRRIMEERKEERKERKEREERKKKEKEGNERKEKREGEQEKNMKYGTMSPQRKNRENERIEEKVGGVGDQRKKDTEAGGEEKSEKQLGAENRGMQEDDRERENESDARCYYNICPNVTPDSACSLTHPHPKAEEEEGGGGEEEQGAVLTLEPVPILQPPPGFGDSSSDEEFFDARDRFASPEDPTSGTVSRVSYPGPDQNQERNMDWNPDHVPDQYPDRVQNRTESSDESQLLSLDPEPSEQSQNPCPTVSSLSHTEGEAFQLESKPILTKPTREGSHQGPGDPRAPDNPKAELHRSSRSRRKSMETEPDVMESKSVTALVTAASSSITAVRCRVEPDGKESTDRRGDGEEGEMEEEEGGGEAGAGPIPPPALLTGHHRPKPLGLHITGKIQSLPLYLSRSQETLTLSGVGSTTRSPSQEPTSDKTERWRQWRIRKIPGVALAESDDSEVTLTESEVGEVVVETAGAEITRLTVSEVKEVVEKVVMVYGSSPPPPLAPIYVEPKPEPKMVAKLPTCPIATVETTPPMATAPICLEPKPVSELLSPSPTIHKMAAPLPSCPSSPVPIRVEPKPEHESLSIHSKMAALSSSNPPALVVTTQSLNSPSSNPPPIRVEPKTDPCPEPLSLDPKMSSPLSSCPSAIVVTTQSLNGPGLSFPGYNMRGRPFGGNSFCKPPGEEAGLLNTLTTGCGVFTSTCETQPNQAHMESYPLEKPDLGCSSVLVSGCEVVLEGVQTPLEACRCPPPLVYTNCFSGGDSFDDELTVYEFSCRTIQSPGRYRPTTPPPLPTAPRRVPDYPERRGTSLSPSCREGGWGRGEAPRETCATHFSENKRLLHGRPRRLMAGCQKVVRVGQTPDEMLLSLSDSFKTLVGMAGMCLWFSGCDRCDRRNAEALAGLAGVARTYREFVAGGGEARAGGGRCHDLSTKLLAKQCTALTASVFCLTQLFRTLTAL